MVISAGTRNHFALDLGLDRDDPAKCLDALRDGVELRIDLGRIGDRTFVNNASFGAYAAVVQSPAYRDGKTGTTLQMLPDLLTGEKGPRLVAHTDKLTVEAPQALLVSNNPYEIGDIAGLGRRGRLDRGVLGVIGIKVENAAQVAAMIAARHRRGLTTLQTREVTIDADRAEIPVGVDGEALVLPTPVRCTISAGALRVRVPRDRPGVAPMQPAMSWSRLGRLALSTGRR
jgi:diacylglycerol kinase family enzyme